MLTITIPESEQFNQESGEFIQIKKQTLVLEHSLVSVSKWESKWNKPFLSNKAMSNEETIDYVRCMTITQNVDPIVYFGITDEVLKEITDYIDSPMTATWFSSDKNKNKKSQEIITAEIIYYYMISLGIPFECQKWHLNRLLTLIRVCSEKNTPQKSMSKQEILSRNRALNAARKKAHNTRG